METDHTEIYKMFGEIKGELGFINGELKGVNQRLDIINGRLNSHAKDIEKLNTFKTSVNVKTGMIASAIALGISLLGYFIKK